MKYFVLFPLMFCLSGMVCATDQVQEELWIDGAIFYIQELPLQQYPDLEKISGNFIKASCSGNWRGYKGYWVIRDEEIWLSQLQKDNPCTKEFEYLDLASVFERENVLHGIRADWVSGEISFRISKITHASSYEYYEYEAVVYTFDSGQLKNRKIKTIRVNRRKH